MLQTQLIDIDLAKGIETQVDDKVLTGKNLVLENASFDKISALKKTHGWEKLDLNTFDDANLDTTIKGIAKSGDTFVCFDENRKFYRYSQLNESLYEMEGSILPAKITIDDGDFENRSQLNPDIAYNSRLNIKAVVFCEDEEIRLRIIRNGNIESYCTVSSVTGLQSARVGILDNGTTVKIAVSHPTTSTPAVSFFNTECELLSSIATTFGGNGAVMSDNGTSLYIYGGGGTSLKIYKINHDETLEDDTFTTTSNMHELAAYCHDNKLFVLYANDVLSSGSEEHFLRSIVIDDDLSGVAISDTAIGSVADFISMKLSVVAIDDNVYFYSHCEGYSSGGGYDGEQRVYLFNWTYSGANYVTLLASEVVFNASLESEVCIDGDGYRYAALGYDSLSQDTIFFCRLDSYTPPSGSGYGGTYIWPRVLSKTTKGLGRLLTGVSSKAEQVSKLICESGKLYTSLSLLETFETNVSNPLYAIRPIEIDLSDYTFSSDQFGKTNLIASGLVLDISGKSVYENGFFLSPEILNVTAGSSGSAISAGTRSYKLVFEHTNDRGETTYSTPSNEVSVTNGAGVTNIQVEFKIPSFGDKLYERCKLSIYRTLDSGTIHYKVNEFLPLFPLDTSFTFTDESSDSDIQSNETLYSVVEIENDSAPTATHVHCFNDRAFLSGLKFENQIGYSKLGVERNAPSFSDFFRIGIDKTKLDEYGGIVGVSSINDKIITFKESAVYFILGNGPDNTGNNDNFTRPEIISTDLGCSEIGSLIKTPVGIMFKSKKGFYKIDGSLTPQYIGNSVHEYNGDTVLSSVVIEDLNEVRFSLDSDKTLSYNYLLDEWAVFTKGFENLIEINSEAYGLRSGSVYKKTETFTDNASFYSLKVKTPWLKIASIAGFQRVKRAIITGEYKSSHTLTVRIYYDYDTSTYEEHTFTADSAQVYQLECHIANQKCSAIMFEIFDNPVSGGESMELSKLTLQVGIKKGSAKIPSARKF